MFFLSMQNSQLLTVAASFPSFAPLHQFSLQTLDLLSLFFLISFKLLDLLLQFSNSLSVWLLAGVAVGVHISCGGHV
jgi:hypothetical protein